MNKKQIDRVREIISNDCGTADEHFGSSSKDVEELVNGPTCVVGAFISDGYKQGKIEDSDVLEISRVYNEDCMDDVPSWVDDLLYTEYGIDEYLSAKLQYANDIIRGNEPNNVEVRRRSVLQAFSDWLDKENS